MTIVRAGAAARDLLAGRSMRSGPARGRARGRRAGLSLVAVTLALVWSEPAPGFNEEEHRELADEVLIGIGSGVPHGEVSALLDSARADLWRGMGFGEVCAWSSRRDHARGRHHRRATTVLDQLQKLDRETLAHWLAERMEQVRLGPEPADNVVANFLAFHLAAIGRAAGARSDGRAPDLERALIYEAVAVGYLQDAFAAGHLLLPGRSWPTWLQHFNVADAHDYYGEVGVYCLNSRGEVWQTFGDGLLFWYRTTHDHVAAACRSAVSEVLLAYLVGTNAPVPEALQRWFDAAFPGVDPTLTVSAWTQPYDGGHYYRVLRMPSILEVPMPVTATWSVPANAVDSLGLRLRHHYPQLADDGLHDPDTGGIDAEFLYRRESIPDWMVFPRLLDGADPVELVRIDPSVASVRFIQERRKKASYRGTLIMSGVGYVGNGPDAGVTPLVALGFGFVDEFVPLRSLPSVERASVELEFLPVIGGSTAQVAAADVTFQVRVGSLPSLHLECGYARGGSGGFEGDGTKLALGLSSRTLRVPVLYTGIAVRAKYAWYHLDDTVAGTFVEVVFH